jgi:hypothetical protein
MPNKTPIFFMHHLRAELVTSLRQQLRLDIDSRSK